MEFPVEVLRQVPGHRVTHSTDVLTKCSETSLVAIIHSKVRYASIY